MDSDSSFDEPPSKRRRVTKKQPQVQYNEDVNENSSEEGESVEDNNNKQVVGGTSNEEESNEEESNEEESDDSESDDSESEDNNEFNTQKKKLNEDEEFQISYKYRQLNESLAKQRVQLTTENGVEIVKKTLDAAEDLFENMKISSNTVIIAKDSATLKEIGEQAKIATQNVKFGQSEKALKFETFISSWMSCFGTIRQQRQNIDYNENTNIPEYNWSNAGLLFNSMSKHITGCDFLLGPLEIEKKKRIMKQRLVDDSNKNSTTKTADLKKATDVINKDIKDDTSKTAERLYKRLQQYGQKISLFEAVLHPTSFGKSIECMFVCSFLINNGHLIMNKYENGIPYLELANKDNIKLQRRFKDNDDSKSHIIFSLDEETWKELVNVYQITEPFFTNSDI